MFSIWSKVTESTENELMKLGHTISFNSPKNDDSHVKANTGFGYSNWVFARTQGEVWVELELKPIKKVPQDKLYQMIKSKKVFIDEKMASSVQFSHGGNDRRIKVFIKNHGMSQFNKEECIEKMVIFVSTLKPIIVDYYNNQR